MSEIPKLLSAGSRKASLPLQGKNSLKSPPRLSRQGGYSMTEVLVVISVIGIMAAVAIGMMTGGVQTAKMNTASANLEALNDAVRKYSHAVKDLTNTAESGSSDELAVITELKIDGTVEARPGSPYLGENINPVASSDTTKFRASWNGSEFQIIGPGTNGSGVDLMDLQ